jgi:hypothetical protein
VNGDIDFPSQQRFFDILDEKPFAPYLEEGKIDPVSFRFYMDQGHFDSGMKSLEAGFDPIGLPQG